MAAYYSPSPGSVYAVPPASVAVRGFDFRKLQPTHRINGPLAWWLSVLHLMDVGDWLRVTADSGWVS